MTLLIPQKRQSLCHRNLKYPLKVKIFKRHWAKLLIMVRNCLSVSVKWIDFPMGLSVHFATNQGVKGDAWKRRQFWTIWSFFYGWRSLFKIKLAALQIISPGKSEIYWRNLFWQTAKYNSTLCSILWTSLYSIFFFFF